MTSSLLKFYLCEFFLFFLAVLVCCLCSILRSCLFFSAIAQSIFFLYPGLIFFFFFFTRPINVGSRVSFDFSRFVLRFRSYVLTISSFLISIGSNVTPIFSIPSIACSSLGEYNVIAVPFNPLRPVRPTRWIKKSKSAGTSALMTWDTPSISIPRAARSVATTY